MRQLRLRRALAGSVWATHPPSAHRLSAEAHAFVRDLDDPSRPPNSPSDGGLAYGGEFTLRKRLTRHLYGWVAHTLMWAQRELVQVGDGTRYAVSSYDQRHNLVAVPSARPSRNWQLGGRFRLTSGLPYTPIVGTIGSAGEASPIYGLPLSDTFPIFHQLDVRVDKRWILKRTIINAYVDIQNIYNHQNTEAYFYSSDYRRRVGGLSLPILPLVGIRVEI